MSEPAARRRLACLAAAAALAAACAGARRPLPPPQAAERPWLLPDGAYGTQRLFRCSYRGRGGDGGFRATLRLPASGRFDLALVDPLGRQLASLRVDGESALLVDHRRGTHCGRLDAAYLPGVGALPLRPRELPAVLLGALPAAPGDPRERAAEVGNTLEVTDASDRRFRATMAEGLVTEWEVQESGGMPWTWRRRAGRGGVLSTPGGPEIECHEVVVEPLRSPVPPLVPPPGSAESCRLGDDEGAAG